jgi:hypothetical protein
LEVYPQTLHCWAKIPTDIRVNVRAENLPFRSQQRGVVTISSDGQDPIEVPVTARVSLLRESWRLTRRALSTAFPESWQVVRDTWRFVATITGAVARFFSTHAWLFWLLWLLASAAIGVGLYYWPDHLTVGIGEYTLSAPDWWVDYVAPVALGPPLVASSLWLILLVAGLTSGAVVGFFRGIWKAMAK